VHPSPGLDLLQGNAQRPSAKSSDLLVHTATGAMGKEIKWYKSKYLRNAAPKDCSRMNFSWIARTQKRIANIQRIFFFFHTIAI